MDDSENYTNVKLVKIDSRSLSRDGLNANYAMLNLRKDELNIDEDEDPPIASGTISATAQEDGLNSTDAVVKRGEDELLNNEDEDRPTASGPDETLVATEAGAQKQEPKQNIGNRYRRKIGLLCLVTFALVAIVAGLSIYVSQTHRTLVISDRNWQRLWEQHQDLTSTQRQCQQQVQELNSTLASENTRLDISQRNCLRNISVLSNNLFNLENNISVLSSDLSELNQKHNDLRRQFKQLEMKDRIISERKDKLCQYLTSRREQNCPQNWKENEGRCYFISTMQKSHEGAREHCSKFDAILLEINSNQEENFVFTSVGVGGGPYWIGKCRDGNVISGLLFKILYGKPSCRKCLSTVWAYRCRTGNRFICEKSLHLYPDIPEEIRDLCQQPVGWASISSLASLLQEGDQN